MEEVGGRAVAVDRLEFDAGEGGLEGGAGADQGFQELPFAAGAVHVVRGEEVGAGGEEAEGGGEGVGVGGGEEGEVAGVGPQGGVEGGGAVGVGGVVGDPVAVLLDVLPEGEGEAVAGDGAARDERAGWDDRGALGVEPVGHVEFRLLAVGERFRCLGRRQDDGDAGDDGRGGEVDDDREEVVEDPRVGHGQAEVAARGDGGVHGGGGAAGELFRGGEAGHGDTVPRGAPAAETDKGAGGG